MNQESINTSCGPFVLGSDVKILYARYAFSTTLCVPAIQV